jgi:hypothetical protein
MSKSGTWARRVALAMRLMKLGSLRSCASVGRQAGVP